MARLRRGLPKVWQSLLSTLKQVATNPAWSKSYVYLRLFFFAIGAVFVTADRYSTAASHRRGRHVTYLLVAPFDLVLQELNLTISVRFVLVLIILLGMPELLGITGLGNATPATFRLWLVIWLIEAALPLLLHLALRSHVELERVWLLVAGLALLAGTLVAFLVFAPDLQRQRDGS